MSFAGNVLRLMVLSVQLAMMHTTISASTIQAESIEERKKIIMVFRCFSEPPNRTFSAKNVRRLSVQG